MSTSASAAIPLSFLVKIITYGGRNRLLAKEIAYFNVKRSAHAMSMCHWRHVTCDINLEGDIRKYIIAVIQSECTISTGGITIQNISLNTLFCNDASETELI